MVSLIVPCYNAEPYINRCLDSILSQTYRDIELILVNDGSTDQTDALIRSRQPELEQTFTKFIYVVQENQGVGAACSTGFSHATGAYVCLLDSDDLLLPDSVKLRAAYLDTHTEYALVRTNGYYVDEDAVDRCDRLLETSDQMKTKEDIFQDLFLGTTYVWPGTYMIRMEVLKAYYPDQRIYPSRNGQNLQFLMMAAYKNRAGFIDVPLMKYVIRKESLSHFSQGDVLARNLKALEGYADIRTHLIDHYIAPGEREELHRQMEQLYAAIRMQLALRFKNKPLMDENYRTLLAHGGCDWDTRIRYYYLMNPPLCLALRVVRKGKHLLLKAAYKAGDLRLKLTDRAARKRLGTPRVLSMDETLDRVVAQKCSVARFGDGELKLVSGQRIRFQDYDQALSRRLAQVLKADDADFLVCISDIFEGANWMLPKAQTYTWKIVAQNRESWTNALNLNRVYGNAFLSRCYMDWKDKSRCSVWFDKVKQIWQGRDVVILEGEQSRLGYGNDLFNGAASVRRILCPPRDAFRKYDDILNAALELPKDTLLLLALGPTATVLAWDLYQKGYQAVDIGHVDIEYEWFQVGATEKVAVAHKYTNEAIGGDHVDQITDETFQNQIICVIKD